MANVKYRTCYRVADAYCGSCAAPIMARVLDPFFRGHQEKSGWSRPGPPAPKAQERLFR